MIILKGSNAKPLGEVSSFYGFTPNAQPIFKLMPTCFLKLLCFLNNEIKGVYFLEKKRITKEY